MSIGGVERGPDRHVVHGVGGSGQQPAHSGAVVVAVGTPERRKLIAGAILGALSQSIRAELAASKNATGSFTVYSQRGRSSAPQSEVRAPLIPKRIGRPSVHYTVCHHVALLTPEAFLRLGVSPGANNSQCRGAVLPIKWRGQGA